MGLTPIAVKKSYEQVFHQLEQAILDGDLAIGEALPSETALCKEFQLTRSSVREGIRLLEQSGLVMRNSARRLVVTAPDLTYFTGNVIRSIALNQITMRELWQVVRELETLSASLAVANVTDELVDALHKNLQATKKHRSDNKKVSDFDEDFHRLIAETSNNRALELSRSPLCAMLFGATEFVLSHEEVSTDRLIEAHELIYDAIRNQDGATATLWMRRHVDDLKRGFDIAGADFDAPVARMIDQSRLYSANTMTTSHPGMGG